MHHITLAGWSSSGGHKWGTLGGHRGARHTVILHVA